MNRIIERFSLSTVMLIAVGFVLFTALILESSFRISQAHTEMTRGAEKQAAAALDMLEAVHTSAMLLRKKTADDDPAIDTLNMSMEQFSRQNKNVKLWLVMAKPVIDYQLANNQTELEGPRDEIDTRALHERTSQVAYPRWIKTDVKDKGRAIGSVLMAPPLQFDLNNYTSPQSPEILIAGCGTGQHVVNTSSRFSNTRIVAVDLSLSSLSYAARKTEELGLTNIEFVHGDIMELATIDRQFDLIECSGVLHHLGDPLAGWRVLTDLLQPSRHHENRPVQ